MSSKIGEGSSYNKNKTAEVDNAQAAAAGTSKDAKGSEGTRVSRGKGGGWKSKGAKPKTRKGAKAKASGRSKLACEKKISMEEVAVGAEVDVKAKVTNNDLPKERLKETFGDEVAENMEEVAVGAEVDVKAKVTDKEEQSKETFGDEVAEKSMEEVAVGVEVDVKAKVTNNDLPKERLKETFGDEVAGNMDEVAVGTEVDVKAKVTDKEEQSKETFGDEVAENMEEGACGVEVDVKAKVTDKDLQKEQSKKTFGDEEAAKNDWESDDENVSDDDYYLRFQPSAGYGRKPVSTAYVDTLDAATQVDITAWARDCDIRQESSPEEFWRKVAERTQVNFVEVREMNRVLHGTIDYLVRENHRFQLLIDQHFQIRGAYRVTIPLVHLPYFNRERQEDLEDYE